MSKFQVVVSGDKKSRHPGFTLGAGQKLAVSGLGFSLLGFHQLPLSNYEGEPTKEGPLERTH
jgi:hypothetical protein